MIERVIAIVAVSMFGTLAALADATITPLDAVSDPSSAVGKRVEFTGQPLQRGVIDGQPYQNIMEMTTGSMWLVLFSKDQQNQLLGIQPGGDEVKVMCTIIEMNMMPKCKLITISVN